MIVGIIKFSGNSSGNIGRVVSLSADGMLVAVGSDGDDGCFDRASCPDGFARVYGYIGNQWIQIGSDLAESGVPDFGGKIYF